MSETIFTKIINREIPGEFVYEDDLVAAFLTIEPVQYGHTLVVPKKPFENIFDGDPESLAHMMKIGQMLGQAMKRAGITDGVNLYMNNGTDAGQEVFHAHLHVVPRLAGDQALHVTTIKNDPSVAIATAEKIKAAL